VSVLLGPDGKFYDIPDDRLAGYAVAPEKVRETLQQASVPAPGGEMGPGGGGPPGMGMHGSPMVIQINPAPMPSPPPSGAFGPEERPGGEGQVEPYWWYHNHYWYHPW
jgi:hypothetical protein